MNYRKVLLFALLYVCLFQFSYAGAQTNLWVTGSDARLKADKSASSQTIAELDLGTALSVLSYEGRWYEVSLKSGHKGWIYRGKVSDTPPESSKNQDTSNLFSALGTDEISADSADTSRSIRGLSPEAVEYADNTGVKQEHRTALDNALKIQTSTSEIEQFLKKGKIGEYAQ
ncbi:SH3 domain-containing protein [Desulfonema limicola]|uniref:SH3 domain-containing protein n=1 Tax=Desulfonema limicola TaxID=45656 RepID=A0A975BBX5_9BACT|nr:SH3 domain-containing protein [Desulfonema limicola]QTA82420.1 SH3 domain-containing protein [Desulfonema limicola]